MSKSTIIIFVVIIISLLLVNFVKIYIYFTNVSYKKDCKKADVLLCDVKNLSPREFEVWIAELMKRAGYKVFLTKQSGDFGADVIATDKNGVKIAIQVKLYTNPLGIKCVQEVIGGMIYYKADKGWVMSTTPHYTKAAKELAEKYNIELFNYYKLYKFLEKVNKGETNG